jgi:hypothetical protein
MRNRLDKKLGENHPWPRDRRIDLLRLAQLNYGTILLGRDVPLKSLSLLTSAHSPSVE